jgi:hypothetical protein
MQIKPAINLNEKRSNLREMAHGIAIGQILGRIRKKEFRSQESAFRMLRAVGVAGGAVFYGASTDTDHCHWN